MWDTRTASSSGDVRRGRRAAVDEIVVAGVGATTPLGGDVKTFWEGLVDGRSGVVALADEWATELPVRIAVPMEIDPAETLPRVQARRLDRVSQAALVAAREAWADASFGGTADENGLDPTRVAVVIGTGIGGAHLMITEYENLRAKGPRRVSPLLIPMTMANGPAATVGPELGAQAGVHTPVSAGASGSEAVAYGLDLLHLDRADLVVVGGAEACIHPLTMSGFAQMRAMSGRCRRGTTSPDGPRVRGTEAATGSSWARARGSSSSSAPSTRPPAAEPPTPCSPEPPGPGRRFPGMLWSPSPFGSR